MRWRLLFVFLGFAALSGGTSILVLAYHTNGAISVPFLDLIVVLSITLLLAVLPAWYLSRRFVRPLLELTEGANRIAGGDYGHRIHGGVWGESRSLAKTFNKMSKGLAAQFTQLESDRRQLRAILGGMIEGVIAVDSEQCILFANEAAGRVLDFPPEGAVGRKFWEVTRQPDILSLMQRALAGSEPLREELSSVGSISRQLAIYVAPLSGETTHGAVLVLHDMTELRRLERLRQDFVANVSHELKTPLTVIRSHVEALMDGAMDDPSARVAFLDQIAHGSDRLYALILDLLSLWRIESGEQAFEFQEVSLDSIVRECLERHTPRAGVKHLSLEYDAPPTSHWIWADEEAVGHILDNLVDNAVKYTGEGGRIEVSLQDLPDHVSIQVKDNGPGIPEADLPRIFERFYRVDKARSRSMGGTGLGLAIVKHLVNEMKGTIGVESTIRKGTTFTVRFPKPASS